MNSTKVDSNGELTPSVADVENARYLYDSINGKGAFDNLRAQERNRLSKQEMYSRQSAEMFRAFENVRNQTKMGKGGT
jgi:hypothetical protein